MKRFDLPLDDTRTLQQNRMRRHPIAPTAAITQSGGAGTRSAAAARGRQGLSLLRPHHLGTHRVGDGTRIAAVKLSKSLTARKPTAPSSSQALATCRRGRGRASEDWPKRWNAKWLRAEGGR